MRLAALPAREAVFFVALVLASCRHGGAEREPEDYFSTWSSLGQSEWDLPLPGVEQELARGDYPVAGIVSHHLLAGKLIDSWLQRLAARRDVGTFIILSPRHWGVGTGSVSTTRRPWKTAGGFVSVDSRALSHVLSAPVIAEEPEVFLAEHGVSTLVPFIRKHFPAAKLLALAYEGEPPVSLPWVEDLYRVLEPFLSRRGRREYFLLVSTDFSHHAGVAETAARDAASRVFLRNPGMESWIHARCDNRPAMYLMARLCEGMQAPRFSVLYHSSSYELTGEGEQDITSYFFAYLLNGKE